MKKEVSSYYLVIQIMLFVLLIGFVFSAYFHELGHKNAAKKYGVHTYIKLRWPDASKRYFSMASTVPLTKEDCEKANSLGLVEKQEIALAGPKNDMVFSIVLLIISIPLIVYSYKHKNKWIYSLIIILIFLAILVVYQININLAYLPGRDAWLVYNNITCPA